MAELICGWAPQGCPGQGGLPAGGRSQGVGSEFVDLKARPWCLAVDQFGRKNTGRQETRA